MALPEGTASAPSKTPAVNDIEAIFCPGDRIAGYEIEKVLGIGSLAVVYGAVQLSLGRHVALKIPLARLSRHSLFAQQFDREAGRIAGLSHPNLVNILDTGRQGDLHYFVLEHVDGVPLETAIVRGILSYGDYLAVIRQVREALKYVHGEGIAHLDLKPSNILLSRNGQVKIGDFAIARMALTLGEEGSPAGRVYRAPELRARRPGIDARADVYSLGITYHRMFCRAFPENGLARAAVLNPALPKAVDGVLQEAIASQPEDRYESVQRLTVELLSSLMGMAAFFQIDNIAEESEHPTNKDPEPEENYAPVAAAKAASPQLQSPARVAQVPPAAPAPVAAPVLVPRQADPAPAIPSGVQLPPRTRDTRKLVALAAVGCLAAAVALGGFFMSRGEKPAEKPVLIPLTELTKPEPVSQAPAAPQGPVFAGVLEGWVPSDHPSVQKALAEGQPIAIYFWSPKPTLSWADFETNVLGSPAVRQKLAGVLCVVENVNAPANPALARYGKAQDRVLTVVGRKSRSIARFDDTATPDQVAYALSLL